MRIGTVTFSESKENYGQILQCFALVKFLRIIGYKSFLIRVRHEKKDNRNIIQKFLDKLKIVFSGKLTSIIKEKIEQNRQHRNMEVTIDAHDRKFTDFINKNIPCTPIWYNDESIIQSPPTADAYICGSDQIWGGDLPFMYLTFAKDKLKIAYAASFGGIIPSGETFSKIKDFLASFKWISLRESSGVELCKKMGYEKAEVVPDPTLLLTKEIYKELYGNFQNKMHYRPYLLLYLLGNQISLEVREIMNFAKNQGMEVKYITAHGRDDDFKKIYPTIEEWLQLIENATCVITNSYHGTIFSIIFRKKFVTIPIVGIRSRMNTRLTELLSRYDLTERLYQNSLKTVLKEVDYSTFEYKNKVEREYVTNKLMSVLNSNVI